MRPALVACSPAVADVADTPTPHVARMVAAPKSHVVRTVSCPTDLFKDAQSRSVSARRQVSGGVLPLRGQASVPVGIKTLMDPIDYMQPLAPHQQLTPRQVSQGRLISPRSNMDAVKIEETSLHQDVRGRRFSPGPSVRVVRRQTSQPLQVAKVVEAPVATTASASKGGKEKWLQVEGSSLPLAAEDAKLLDPNDDEMLQGLAEATRNLKSVMSGIHSIEGTPRDSLSLQGLETRIRGLEDKFVAVTNAFEKTFQMCEALEYNHGQKVAELRTHLRQDLASAIDDKLNCMMLDLADRPALSPIQETIRREDDLLDSVKELRIESIINMVTERVVERFGACDSFLQPHKEPQVNPSLPSQVASEMSSFIEEMNQACVSSLRREAEALPPLGREDFNSPQALFNVGERVEVRDGARKWNIGIVTSTNPLLVRVEGGDDTKGYSWSEVRKGSNDDSHQFCDTIDTIRHDIAREPILEDAQEDFQDDVALESTSTWECNHLEKREDVVCVS